MTRWSWRRGRVDPVRRRESGPRVTSWPEGALVRSATCIDGEVDLFVNCTPLFDYGIGVGTWDYVGGGYEVASCTSDQWWSDEGATPPESEDPQ